MRHRNNGGVDFALADVDAALGEALAQPLGHDLVGQRTAEILEGQAVGGQALAQAVDRQAILLGDRRDRLVQFLVADADAVAARALDLKLGQHEALEHLPFEHGAWRQLVFAAGVLGNDVAHRQVQFALQYHVLVHDRGDALDRLQLLGRGGEREGKGGGNRQEGRGKAWAHGLTESGSDRNRPDRAWCCWAGPGTGRRGSSRE